MQKRFSRLFCFVFSFLLLNIFFTVPVSAGNFTSLYKTTYEYTLSGETKVIQEISLVNNTSDYYVSQYNLNLEGGNLTKIEAYDQIGSLQTSYTVKNGVNLVNIKFNEKVVGKDKVLSFILKYNVSGLAEKEGNLWSISVPKLSNASEIDDFQLTLKVPILMGKIAFIDPNPASQETKDNYYWLNFDKKDLLNHGIVATFGGYQTFNFRLLYDLENDQDNERLYEIALPPDTNYQTVYFQKLEPLPREVKNDQDGNWLAVYLVEPKKNLSIVAEGKVNIFSNSNALFKSEKPLDDYLKPQKYWPSENQEIKDLANKLKTPKRIFDYVVNNLEYDEKEIKSNPSRRGAIGALQNPKKCLCSEFTDLFIALCRAANIPAREHQGFAYTQNPKLFPADVPGDLLHSWPEYFDEAKHDWVMVDPTWQNTTGGVDYFNKLDMSHFTFVVHGLSDTYPLPAGSYRLKTNDKTGGSNNKMVFVNFGQDESFPQNAHLELFQVSTSSLFSLNKTIVKVTLRNNLGVAGRQDEIVAQTEADIFPKKVSFDAFLPFSKQEYSFSIRPKELLKDYNLVLNLNYQNQVIPINFMVESLLLRVIIIGGSLLAVLLVYLLIKIKRKNLPEKNPDDTLNKEEPFEK